MAEGHDDGSIAPRRSLSGPILPPPPPGLTGDAAQADASPRPGDAPKASGESAAAQRPAASKRAAPPPPTGDTTPLTPVKEPLPATTSKGSDQAKQGPPKVGSSRPRSPKQGSPKQGAPRQGAPRRNRRAQLRLVQVDAWSVMKTSFLLSIALGIVLVVAVAIIMSVLGAAGVWDSINSIVQQAVGTDTSKPFDIQEYVGTSRILGFAMIVAVLDVILITAIATLGTFLYNLSAALLGGIEVTLAEDD